MGALDRVHPSAGVASMQAINVTVLNPLFLLFFIGTALLSLVLCAFALVRWHHPSSAWLLAGGVLYVGGSLLVTAARNVPLNKTLAKLDPSSLESLSFWKEYISKW